VAVRPIPSWSVGDWAVRAQYVAGSLDGEDVPGYRHEERVAPDSYTETYAAYWRHMLDRGVYLAPSQFEASMISLALTDADLDQAAAAAAEWFAGAGA